MVVDLVLSLLWLIIDPWPQKSPFAAGTKKKKLKNENIKSKGAIKSLFGDKNSCLSPALPH